MNTFKQLAAIVALLALAGNAIAAEHPSSEHPKPNKPAKGSGMLDGKMVAGEIGKTGEEKGDKDMLIFKNGTFTSSACAKYGFHASPYKAEKSDDGKIAFTVNATNEAGEQMSWSGYIDNGKVEATAVHQSESGKTEYWYKGSLESKEGKLPAMPKKPEHPSSEHPQ